jgi:hypothetical protein
MWLLLFKEVSLKYVNLLEKQKKETVVRKIPSQNRTIKVNPDLIEDLNKPHPPTNPKVIEMINELKKKLGKHD